MDNGNVKKGRVGTHLIIQNSDGSVWGRAVPRSNGVGYLLLRLEKGKAEVTKLTLGPVELASKMESNGWEVCPSYITVSAVRYDSATKTVTVVFSHNVWEGWNQIITVPFGESWKKAVTEELIARSSKTGSETHVFNFQDLLV